MATSLTPTVQTVAKDPNGGNHDDDFKGRVGLGQRLAPRLPFPDTLLAKEVNVVEALELAKVILDKDSPHGAKEADWAIMTLENKLKKLNLRYERSIGPDGEETKSASSINRRIGFLDTAYSIVLSHVEKLKAAQAGFKVEFDSVVAKWDQKKKIPDFADSVLARWVTLGGAVAAPILAKVSRLWDGLMGALKSVVTPQKQWIVDIAEVAAPTIGGLLDIAAAYWIRKKLINWAANRKSRMDEKKQAEMGQVEKNRQAMLRDEYDKVQREIVALLWPSSQLN